MSQASTETSGQAPQLDKLEGLNAAVKGQKTLLFISLGLATSALLFAIAIFVLGNGESADTEPEAIPYTVMIRQLESQIESIEAQIEEREQAALQTATALSELSTHLGRIDVNDERNTVNRMQSLAIKQEQDFRIFLSTLEAGLYNFHMMIPHSRGWWDEYKADLDEAIQLSEAREEYAKTLRDN